MGVCDALKELMKDELDIAEKNGIEQGMIILIDTCKELVLTRQQTAEKVASKYNLSADQTEALMNKNW